MTTRLWLVRHGATEWSQSGRHTGSTDLPLLPQGEADARFVGSILQHITFAHAFTSPLIRARETAHLAGFIAEPTDDLREWEYGDIEGRTTAELREEIPGWTIWRDGCPGGETLEQVGDRADKAIESAMRYDGDVLVFAHGHILRILGARWAGAEPSFAEHLMLSTTSISVLGWEREARSIERWNDTSHLYP